MFCLNHFGYKFIVTPWVGSNPIILPVNAALRVRFTVDNVLQSQQHKCADRLKP